MTRKELCKETGISVKTLRLYEEKGLIAPGKETRNGREYRAYSEELVSQLREILLLRKALFTMEEIRVMQQQPEKIPDIFKTYQDYLEQQTQVLEQLCRAAERVDPDSLGNIHSLVDGLRDTAEEMPLPQMDVRPNFKRIDELDEGPRHVQQQLDFDETVPNARVMRQMNLMMDGDRTNNINIAFGQFNDLRRNGGVQEAGPVQREKVYPRWYRVLSGVLTALVLASIVILLGDHRSGDRWLLFLGTLGVRLLVLGLPLIQEKLRWYREHGQSTEASRQAERKHTTKIIAWILVGVLVVGGLITGVCVVLDRQMNPPADLQVVLSGSHGLQSKNTLRLMEDIMSPLVSDLNGDGETHVDVPQEWESDVVYPLIFKVETKRYAGDPTPAYSLRREYITLPETIADPDSPYQVNITGIAPLEAIGYGELTAYAYISKDATPEQQEAAIALLEQLLAP